MTDTGSGVAHPRVTPLGLFVAGVIVAALPILVWSLAALLLQPRQFGVDRLVIIFLLLGVIIGELTSVEVVLQDSRTYLMTLSTTFIVALIFAAPLGLVILAQCVPLLIDDLKQGRHWSRPVFNLGQYVLAVAAGRWIFSLVAHQAFFVPEHFQRDDVGPAILASGAYFLVNNGLVVTVIALASRRIEGARLWIDVRQNITTWGPMVAMAPICLAVTNFSLWLVPLVLMPVIAVHQISKLALEHRHSAQHDALTGLPNRSFFLLQLDRMLAEKAAGEPVLGVMFIDLDHFKEINDTLGHDAGDALICDIGRRLRSAMTDDVTVARLGGDEFAVLTRLSSADPLTEASDLAGKLTATLDDPVSVAGIRLEVRASIGIALAPQHARSSADLLAKADIAMYLAKGNGGGVAVYDPSKDENTTERLLLLTQLHDALADDQLTVYYQPKCDVRSGRVVGAEALVRWQHPYRGLLGADQFIPIAETTELITQLTLVVLEQAISRTRVWLDQGRHLGVAVNLSVRHLADMRLPEQVDSLLKRYCVPPALLTLEVTENTVMTDPHRAVAVLAMLRAGGVRIAIDDYGTGYSSLAYLKRLSVDELKIDRSFITGMTSDDNDQIIVRSTIDLGHNLGLRVVAEGVEDVESWRHLQVLGCDVIQGFTVQAPLSATEFDAWLTDWESHRREHVVGGLAGARPVTRGTVERLGAPTPLPARESRENRDARDAREEKPA